MKIKLSTYTDESGQDTLGKMFVVCTIICPADKTVEIENDLVAIEKTSDKTEKWHKTGDKRRHRYTKLVLESGILKQVKIYYSVYANKTEYSKLVGAHIAKSILNYTRDGEYEAKIFIDKTNKRVLNEIRKEIKQYRIKYKKIRGLTEEASALIRLADAACGLYRDLGHTTVSNSYKGWFKQFLEI